MQRYIKVEDIPKVSSPWHDYGVKEYTAKEIAEEYMNGITILYARNNGKSARDLKRLLDRLGENK